MSPLKIALVCLFVAQFLHAQLPEPEKFDPDVTHWLPATPPAKEDKEKRQRFFAHGNYSFREWHVHVKDGRVLAVPAHEAPREESRPVLADLAEALFPTTVEPLLFTPFGKGWLGAVNRGEFGCTVFSLSADEKKMTKLSTNHHVSQFIRLASRQFAVEGLAHMGTDEGSILEFTHQPEGWKMETFVKLPSCGYAATRLSDEAMYVVTSDALLRVSLDKKVQTLISEPEWGMLYPNSLALDPDGHHLWVGMRNFVVRVGLKSKVPAMEYFVPEKSFLPPLEAKAPQTPEDPFSPATAK
ncbi:MAG: hypothetical protein ACO1TE_26615 [Prosthecobacter sp.]